MKKQIFDSPPKFPARILAGALALKIPPCGRPSTLLRTPFGRDTMLLRLKSLPQKSVFSCLHHEDFFDNYR